MVKYNTVWITDKNPEVVEPNFTALEDKLLFAMINEFAANWKSEVKMTQVGKYTMVEYGHPNKAVFFCDVEDV